MPEQFISLVEQRFQGLNALLPPDEMPEGYLQTANNVLVSGGRGGAMISRPGFRGQMSASISSTAGTAIYAAYVYRQNSGTQSLLFAAGTDTSGMIWKWDKNTLAATALTALGNFSAAAVQFTRLNDYCIISGNLDGILRRLNLANGVPTAETMAGLTQPQYTAVAIPTSRLINLLSTAANWRADTYVSGALVIPDGSWTAVTLGPGRTPGQPLDHNTAWTVLGGSVEGVANSGQSIDANSPAGTIFLRMDDPPSIVQQTQPSASTIPLKTNATGGAGNRRPVHFRVNFPMRSSNVADSLVITLSITDTAGAILMQQTQTAANSNTNAAVSISMNFPFGELDDSLPRFSVLTIGAGPNNHGGANGPYIGPISCTPYVVPAVTFVNDGSQVAVRNLTENTATYTNGLIPIGQARLTYDLGSQIDLSTYQNIAIGWDNYGAFPVSGQVASLGLRSAIASATVTGNAFVFYTDPATSKQYATVDLSSFIGSRSAIRYLDIIPQNDFYFNTTNAGQAPFRLGPLTFAGNLTIGGQYAYRFVEATGAATAGTLITSPAGAPSNDIIADQIRATGEVTATNAAVPTNTGADIIAYRVGGTFLDGLYRKVARFSPTASTTGTYFAWSTAGGAYVFDDYTPDSQLVSSTDFDFILSDHQNPPTACYAVGVYANRLALMAPAGLYISQLQSGKAAGQYYNLAFDSSAPDAPTQGFFTQITGNDGVQSGGTSTRLVNYLSRLWILFTNSIYEFGGTDGFDFALHRFEADENKGLIAARGLVIFDSKLWFLAPDGLRVLDGRTSERVSEIMDRLLNPQGLFSGAPLNAAAYAKGFVAANAGRIYLSAPLPGGTDIGVIYVYDIRGGGVWTSWTPLDVDHRAFYNAVTFSSPTDTDDLAMLGATGQIYLVGPGGAYGDTLVNGGTVTPVTISLMSRAFDVGNQWLQVQRFSLAMEPADLATTATVVVTGQYTASNQYTATCYFAVGETDLARQKVASRVRGRPPYWALYATETAALVVRRFELQAIQGRQT